MRGPMYKTHPVAGQRSGFTLVELLVVISILLILTTLTIGAINLTANADRIKAGANQVQSYLEGARDRAIHAGEARGVRFIENADGEVNSLLFVGAPDDYVGSLDITGSVLDATSTDNDAQYATWLQMGVSNGSLITIADNVYTVFYNTSTSRFELTKNFLGTDGTYSYRLQLPSQPLPNQEAQQLPQGIVVDLFDGYTSPGQSSFVPPSWASGNRDIMFSPAGTVTGIDASFGRIHLLLSDVVDMGQDRPAGDPDKEGQERVVTVTTRTGNISIHPTNKDINDPFLFAETGKAAP